MHHDVLEAMNRNVVIVETQRILYDNLGKPRKPLFPTRKDFVPFQVPLDLVELHGIAHRVGLVSCNITKDVFNMLTKPGTACTKAQNCTAHELQMASIRGRLIGGKIGQFAFHSGPSCK
jgi:hypothetical protein